MHNSLKVQYGQNNVYFCLLVDHCQIATFTYITFTFTFMHLADAFIQSDLHCIQVSFTFDQFLLSLGIEPMILALLAPCTTI